MRIPTDYQLLNAIYEEYKEDYAKYEQDPSIRRVKIYVPIDCNRLAEKLKTEHDIVFGRLYYHLEKKYGYRRDDNTKVKFFSIEVEKDKKCIHFPFMTSILAGLMEERKKYRIATTLSILALFISTYTLLMSLI